MVENHTGQELGELFIVARELADYRVKQAKKRLNDDGKIMQHDIEYFVNDLKARKIELPKIIEFRPPKDFYQKYNISHDFKRADVSIDYTPEFNSLYLVGKELVTDVPTCEGQPMHENQPKIKMKSWSSRLPHEDWLEYGPRIITKLEGATQKVQSAKK